MNYGSYVIYLDVLLILNFCLDFMLLWASGRFLRRYTPLWRLLLASFVGAVYGAAIIFPQLEILFVPSAAVLVSLLLLGIAYPYCNAVAFLRLTGVFYLIACAMAGSVMAGSSLLQRQSISFILPGISTVHAVALLSAVPVILIVSRRGLAALKNNWRKDSFYISITLDVDGHQCSIPAFIDTGNDLQDPLSRLPVIVVDYTAISCLFPHQLCCIIAEHGDHPTEILQQIYSLSGGEKWAKRLRLVPFSSIGRQNGLLLGFRPDNVFFEKEGRTVRSMAIIAVTQKLAGGRLEYQAIVNPDLLTNCEYIKEASA